VIKLHVNILIISSGFKNFIKVKTKQKIFENMNVKFYKLEELREIVIKYTKGPLTLYVERSKGIRVIEDEGTIYWLGQE